MALLLGHTTMRGERTVTLKEPLRCALDPYTATNVHAPMRSSRCGRSMPALLPSWVQAIQQSGSLRLFPNRGLCNIP
jgi:hypothetical protein